MGNNITNSTSHSFMVEWLESAAFVAHHFFDKLRWFLPALHVAERTPAAAHCGGVDGLELRTRSKIVLWWHSHSMYTDLFVHICWNLFVYSRVFLDLQVSLRICWSLLFLIIPLLNLLFRGLQILHFQTHPSILLKQQIWLLYISHYIPIRSLSFDG